MSQSALPNLPGFGAIADTMEFVRNMWGGTSAPGIGIPGMVMPTLSVEEIDKQISDLKAVESWLTLNMNMLRGTIQALEVQSATISALRTMGETLNASVAAAREGAKMASAPASASSATATRTAAASADPAPTAQSGLFGFPFGLGMPSSAGAANNPSAAAAAPTQAAPTSSLQDGGREPFTGTGWTTDRFVASTDSADSRANGGKLMKTDHDSDSRRDTPRDAEGSDGRKSSADTVGAVAKDAATSATSSASGAAGDAVASQAAANQSAFSSALGNSTAWWNLLQDQFKQAVNTALAADTGSTDAVQGKSGAAGSKADGMKTGRTVGGVGKKNTAIKKTGKAGKKTGKKASVPSATSAAKAQPKASPKSTATELPGTPARPSLKTGATSAAKTAAGQAAGASAPAAKSVSSKTARKTKAATSVRTLPKSAPGASVKAAAKNPTGGKQR